MKFHDGAAEAMLAPTRSREGIKERRNRIVEGVRVRMRGL